MLKCYMLLIVLLKSNWYLYSDKCQCHLKVIGTISLSALQWRHNEHDGVSNHQPHDCLLNRLFRPRSKKTSTLRVTGLCAGNSPVTGEFPAQEACNAEISPFDDVIMRSEGFCVGVLPWGRLYLNQVEITSLPLMQWRYGYFLWF